MTIFIKISRYGVFPVRVSGTQQSWVLSLRESGCQATSARLVTIRCDRTENRLADTCHGPYSHRALKVSVCSGSLPLLVLAYHMIYGVVT